MGYRGYSDVCRLLGAAGRFDPVAQRLRWGCVEPRSTYFGTSKLRNESLALDSEFNQVILASLSGSVEKMVRVRKITDSYSSFYRQCEPDRVLPPGRIQPHVLAYD